jgi:phosphatidate cytidylyltransferase
MLEALQHPVPMVFALVYGFLAVATLAGTALSARAGATATMVNLNDRIRSWWYIVTVLAVVFLAGETTTVVLFALVSFWCLREFLSLTPTRPADHYTIAAAFYLFLPLQYWLLIDPWIGVFTIAIPVYAFLALPAIAVLRGETQDFLQRIAKIQWALMLAVYCTSHVPALLVLDVPDYRAGNFGLVAFLILVVQGSDVLQYIFGKTMGKTLLAPTVSPSKTWEGLLLGGGAAVVLGGALYWLTPFGLPGAVGVSAVLVVAGALGGLVLSAVKRSLGAKDWGTMVEGHGGMLDRMDSLAFAAPVFFHLVNYLHAT